jgi:D-serine deaminase-like pyridoxal phosphate-dependent protein
MAELHRNYVAGMCDHQAESLQAHLSWIREHHPQGIAARTLQQYRRGLESADKARLTLQQLVESKYGRFEGDTFIPN